MRLIRGDILKTLAQFFFVLLCTTTLILVGCEEKDDDKINEAQACLNTAGVAGDAAACLSLIEGVGGEKAARIRCALTFLQNGLTQQQIIDTFKDLENPPTSDSPFAYLYSGLAIGDADPRDGAWDEAGPGTTALTTADSQLTTCQASNSASMISIAHISRLGTYTQFQVADNGSGDLDDIGQLTDPARLADLPDDVLTQMGSYTYNQYCNGGNESDSDICETLINAGYGTTTDPATLANNLRTCFANNSCN